MPHTVAVAMVAVVEHRFLISIVIKVVSSSIVISGTIMTSEATTTVEATEVAEVMMVEDTEVAVAMVAAHMHLGEVMKFARFVARLAIRP
jgi:hypothetical protein